MERVSPMTYIDFWKLSACKRYYLMVSFFPHLELRAQRSILIEEGIILKSVGKLLSL